jgi:ligand-binding SRPBCC domain-containing protein
VDRYLDDEHSYNRVLNDSDGGKMGRYQKTIHINAPIEEVFHFHDDTRNLIKITPPSIKVRFTTRGATGLGQDIFLSVKQFGLVQTSWHVRITEYQPPETMVDEQIKGPFATWKQTRHVAATQLGATLTDTVEYTLPFGALGRLADTLFVRKQIENMFAYRQQATKKLLELSASQKMQ